MRVAIQGCSHGSLSAIYDSIHQYTARTSHKIDLLLLCGDFQALRNSYDFASLAVPPKYHALGTFHQYYSGQRVAPVLTIVIGGNHEASNYMWELYHGGWLAPGVYYLGAAGAVNVGGWRIVGASGIFKEHDYNKGHFETMPLNGSTMRSIYHIRSYDIDRLKMLSRKDNTIVLSHDWPTTIPRHGDTAGLLRRKPFFTQEVQSDTLGSPPLFELMKEIRAEYWFSAHLHVKFAAVYEHDTGAGERLSSNSMTKDGADVTGQASVNPDEIAIEDDFDEPEVVQGKVENPDENPDEIAIEDDDFDDPPAQPTAISAKTPEVGPADPSDTSNGASANPDEIDIADDFDEPERLMYQPSAGDEVINGATANGTSGISEVEQALKVDESADLVEEARKAGHPEIAEGVIGTAQPTSTSTSVEATFQVSASELRPRTQDVTKFLALDKCGPGKDFIQFIEVPTPASHADKAIQLTYDPEWLAITRAMHPFLSLKVYPNPLPPKAELERLIELERTRIREEGLLVPQVGGVEAAVEGQAAPVELVWEKGEIEVERVQKFWPTAPAEGQPGGSATAWYTNPQTEAFCGMLGVPNMINPAPTPPS